MLPARNFTQLLRRNSAKLAFVTILLVGTALRFVNFEFGKDVQFDQARDLLVGKHMAFYDGEKMVAPYADGGKEVLLNTPVYFWIVACFWLIGQTHTGVLFLFVVINCFTIVLAYLVAHFFDTNKPKLAIIFSAIIAVSEPLIVASKDIWQPHFIPILVLLTLLLYFLGLRKRSAIILITALCSAFFTAITHYSGFLLFLPMSIVVMGYFVASKKWLYFLGCLVLLVGFFVLWLFLSQSNITGMTAEPTFKVGLIDLLSKLNSPFFLANSSLLGRVFFNIQNAFFAFALLVATILCLIWLYLNSKTRNVQLASVLILTTSCLLMGLYPENLVNKDHYLFVFYIFFALAISVIVDAVLKKNPIFGISLFIVLLWGVNRNYVFNLRPQDLTMYQETMEIASTISGSTTDLTRTTILSINQPLIWYRPLFIHAQGIWFVLEEQQQKPLGIITKDAVMGNYLPFSYNISSEKTFLVCRIPEIACPPKNMHYEEATLIYQGKFSKVVELKGLDPNF